jgi:tRNA (guanine37-N1)-methyltransferase
MMRFEIVTIFPDFFTGPLDYGIVRRARQAGLIEIKLHDLRAFTADRHRTVDDRPFGGGEGMLLKPEPLFDCVESLGVASRERRLSGEAKESVVLLSASGRRFTQQVAQELSQLERVVFVCGRYEGVDERVASHLADRELSVGDFVMSGGELGAALVLDTVTRLLPGALGNEASSKTESFSGVEAGARFDERGRLEPDSTAATLGLLDAPHYTRPAEFRGIAVPEVLLNGNHDEIRRWRRQQSLEKTLRNRPDLLAKMELSRQDEEMLRGLKSGVHEFQRPKGARVQPAGPEE